MRPLKPNERFILLVALFTIAVGVSRGAARNWDRPDAQAAELAILLLGVLLIAGVAWGLKSGFFGASDD
jgi:hypothetical protein